MHLNWNTVGVTAALVGIAALLGWPTWTKVVLIVWLVLVIIGSLAGNRR